MIERKSEEQKCMQSSMLHVGICDDEPVMVNMLEQMILQCNCSMEMKLYKYYSGKELLASTNKLDVVFLDIEMPELDGIETGKLLYRYQPDCVVIMATCREDRVKEAFVIHAFRFITKPYDMEEIREALESFADRRIGMGKIDFYDHRRLITIEEREIDFVRTINSYVEGWIQNRFLRKDISLNTLEKQLDQRLFYRIHRQYLINFYCVKKFDNRCVYLSDYKLPIARSRRTDFVKHFMEFNAKYCWKGCRNV